VAAAPSPDDDRGVSLPDAAEEEDESPPEFDFESGDADADADDDEDEDSAAGADGDAPVGAFQKLAYLEPAGISRGGGSVTLAGSKLGS
jgi:hypothetical protein